MPAGNVYGRPVQYGRSRALGPVSRADRALCGQMIGPNRRVIGADRYWTEIADDNPIGFWPLSDIGASTAVERVADMTLTYLNSPTQGVAGLPRGGVTFNGSNQAADTVSQDALNLTAGGTHSTECWMKYTTSGTTIQTALAWRGVTAVIADEVMTITVNNGTSGRIQANTVNAPAVSRVQVNSDGGWNDGLWHHVVVTCVSGGDMTLYIDGVSRGSTSATRASSGSSGPRVAIAANITGTSSFSQYFAGSVSCAAVYGSALSATRVLAHYRAMADSVSL